MRRYLAIVALLFVSVLAGCDGNSISGVNDSIAGS